MKIQNHFEAYNQMFSLREMSEIGLTKEDEDSGTKSACLPQRDEQLMDPQRTIENKPMPLASLAVLNQFTSNDMLQPKRA